MRSQPPCSKENRVTVGRPSRPLHAGKAPQVCVTIERTIAFGLLAWLVVSFVFMGLDIW